MQYTLVSLVVRVAECRLGGLCAIRRYVAYVLPRFRCLGVMTHDSSYNKCSHITPTLSHLILLRSDENLQRTFYFLHHDEPAVVFYNAQHRTKDYVSLIEVLLNVPLTFATSMLRTCHSGFHRAERTKLHRNFAPNHPN